MPPRIAPGGSRGGRGGGPQRGGGSGGGPRGGGPRGGGRGGPAIRGANIAGGAGNAPSIGAQVMTVGVKRPNFGTSGKPISVFTNAYTTTIPDQIIHHYDVILPSEKTLPARFNMEIIQRLQSVVAPNVFTPRAVYDGRKNMFSVHALDFHGSESQEFDVTMSPPSADAGARPPKIYKVRLTKVAQINPEVLQRFITGKQSHDNAVLTAITALNVVVRMEPTMKYPFNVRSFFTDAETRDIGAGIVLWRGYFQSVRPAIGKMLINLDISTAAMYKPGALIDLCLNFLGLQAPPALSARSLNDRDRNRLQRFLSGLRILASQVDKNGQARAVPRVIKKLSNVGARELSFTLRDGETMTVADYFRRTRNRPLRFPDLLCVEIGSGALIPLEMCNVPPGQIMRKQVPPNQVKEVLTFSAMKPNDRLQSIRNGVGVLSYGQSEYVRQFGMTVDTNAPLTVQARVLKPPVLKYGAGSKSLSIQPANGAWNMVDKKFFKPASIDQWAIIVYENRSRFRDDNIKGLIQGILSSCAKVGINVRERSPIVHYGNGQGRISEQLRALGTACREQKGSIPGLIVAVLPEGGNDIYTAIKYFGDCFVGVATQCLKSQKCQRANEQYFANVCLKINVKLGGINTVPEAQSVTVLTDPQNPTIVMGADVMHPAPGADGRPSFTALVANVDSDTAKYIADTRVQTGRQEMIADLQSMSVHVIGMYMRYRQHAEQKGGAAAPPKRIIFFRDGVSEGQFKQVLDKELPLLKAACEELKIPMPKITFIIVGKRHHVRFFPKNQGDADRSGNCPAGTVVDRDVSHPTEFDFYLQSHGGLLGTSRPAHYNVLYDENGFSADGLQALSFALCHVYARATRSVSIPAPVYYADKVCDRSKNHYDPDGTVNYSESGTQMEGEADTVLDSFKRGFRPVHKNMATLMYFS